MERSFSGLKREGGEKPPRTRRRDEFAESETIRISLNDLIQRATADSKGLVGRRMRELEAGRPAVIASVARAKRAGTLRLRCVPPDQSVTIQ